MPIITHDNETTLLGIKNRMGADHGATQLRSDGNALTAKKGFTSLWGRIKDKVSGNTDQKIRAAETALAQAFAASSGGILPNEEQRRLIADTVRGRGNVRVNDRLDQLMAASAQAKEIAAQRTLEFNSEYSNKSGGFSVRSTETDLIKAHVQGRSEHTDESLRAHLDDVAKQTAQDALPFAERRAELDEDFNRLTQELSECETFEAFDAKFTDALIAREAINQHQAAMNGALGSNPAAGFAQDAMNDAVMNAVQNNPHLQGADRAKAVAVAAIPFECTTDESAGQFLDQIANNDALTPEERIDVRNVALRYASREACLGSQDMTNLARGSGAPEKLMAVASKQQMNAMSQHVVDAVSSCKAYTNALTLNGKNPVLPEPGSPESLGTPGLEDGYREAAVVAIQEIVEQSEKLSPENKQVFSSIKQGGIEAGLIKPSLLVGDANAHDLGVQIASSQASLRAVAPAIVNNAQNMLKNAPESADLQAKAKMATHVCSLIQLYDNFKNHDELDLSKNKNISVDAIRNAQPEMLESYCNAVSGLIGENPVEVHKQDQHIEIDDEEPNISQPLKRSASVGELLHKPKVGAPVNISLENGNEVAPESLSLADKINKFGGGKVQLSGNSNPPNSVSSGHGHK